MYDVNWVVELEPEVKEWAHGMSEKEFARVLQQFERLAEHGSSLRMPASRALGGGLFELRFELGRVPQRITYLFAPRKKIVLLTVFTKQRRNERHEIRRARKAMKSYLAQPPIPQEEQ